MAEIDHDQVKDAFERVNLLLQGKSLPIAVAALQDLLAAAICYGSDDLRGAKVFARDVCRDVRATVEKNFEHYHATARTHQEGNA